MRKGNILLIILVAAVVMVAAVGGYFYLWPRFRYPAQDVLCLDDNQCPLEYYCYKNPENKDMFYLGGPGKCVKGQRQLQVATPSDDPTANWKTYINNLYSLSYPSKYKLSEDKENNRITLDFPGPPPPPDIVIDIKPTPSKTDETTQAFVVEEKTGRLANANIPYRVTGESEISIGGEKWTVLSWSQPDTESFYVVHNNYRFVINKFSVSDGGAQRTAKEFDQILSTFKFLNGTKDVSAVCSNESFGYKIGDYYECQNFNVLYPGNNVMDAPIIITDKNWKEINSCGGMPGPNGPNVCPKQYNWDKCLKKSCN